MAEDVKKLLRGLQPTWKKAPVIEGGFAKVPAGDYPGCQLTGLEVGMNKKGTRLQVAVTLTPTVQNDQNYEGEIKTWFGIDTEVAMGYFKGFCQVVGMEVPDDLTLLPDVCEQFLAENQNLYDVTVSPQKENPDYNNVVVTGLSESVAEVSEPEPEPEPPKQPMRKTLPITKRR